ncbi:hypothetical protein GCM10008932_24710 [Alkalibacterium iburiense]|uniref:Uncharacterized protein n=1 Tax=Alkalibacterium iburiense TaxID=290589 RepID=A0ABN0XTW1_9LACT
MKKKWIVFILSLLIFSVLFVVTQFVYNWVMPQNKLTDLLTLVILVIVFLPTSFFAALKITQNTE